MHNLVEELTAQGYELRETHISWVFLGRDAVYKIKKPVGLGFLDFRTLEQRRHFCAREVELNRRLASSVYLGVVPVTRDARGVRFGGGGEPFEWAVHMRRLRQEDAADVRLREGRLDRAALRRLAEHVARFHASARCDAETARLGEPDAIEVNVRENFEQAREHARELLGDSALAEVEAWQLAFLRDRRARLERRVAAGRIRDGHGDLRLEHCYLADDGAIDIIDCIEFNDRFRYGDVCADVAFLAMDLDWHGRRELSEAFLADYARASGDYDLYGVVDFYESYRAFVRGKVGSLLLADPGASAAAQARAAEQARKYYLLAEACAREPLDPPVLYAVGGVIASGKSTLADQLGQTLPAVVIDSDRARKELAGVEHLSPLRDAAFSGHYGAEASHAVYAELLRRAEVVLRSKRSVILDASFRARAERGQAHELARRLGVPFLFVECVTSEETARARLAKRALGRSVSDGRLEVYDAFVRSFEPVDELPEDAHVRVVTDGPKGAALALVLVRIGRS